MPHLGLLDADFIPAVFWLAEFVGFLLSAFWRPAIGLYIVIPLLPLQAVRYRLHGYFLGDQFTDVLLLGVILGLKRQGRSIIPKTPLNALLLVYVVYTYLSMIRGSFFLNIGLPLWFDDVRVSSWKNYVVDLSLIFLLTVSAIRTKRQMGILLFVMSLGILLLTKSFYGTVSGRDFSTFSYSLRTEGALGTAGVNGLAALTAQASIFFGALFLVERRVLTRLGYLAVVGACLYCVTYTLSRGAYAALVVGIAYLGLVRSRLLLVGLVFFLLGWQSIVPPAVRERVFMTTDDQGNIDSSAATRLSLWEEAMGTFEGDPVFGTGFSTYALRGHLGQYRDTHNLFVKVLVETGVVGLVLFLAIFRRLFQIGFRLYRTAVDPFLKSIGLGFSGLMLAALVTNLFGDRWMHFQITGYTYAFAALAVRAQQMIGEKDMNEIPASGNEFVEVPVRLVGAGA